MEKGYKKRSKNIEILSTITKEENEKKAIREHTLAHTSTHRSTTITIDWIMNGMAKY